MSRTATPPPSNFRRTGDGAWALNRPLLLAYRLLWAAMVPAVLAAHILAASQPSATLARSAMAAGQSLVLIAAAALLVRRRPRDMVAALLSLAFLVWALSGLGEGSAQGPAQPWLAALDRLRFLLFAAALLLFPDGRLEPRWTKAVLILSMLVFAVGLGGAVGLVPPQWFLPPAVLCVVAAIAALAVRLKRLPPGTERQQLKWVSLGVAGGVALILVYRIGGAIAAPAAAQLALEAMYRTGVVLIALGFLVALLRYRLYDAEAAIGRSASYVLLTLALLAVFGACEAAIELLGKSWLGGQAGDISGAIAASVAAVLLVPLHERISGWAERRFQPELVALREALPPLLADAQDDADIDSLAAIVLPRLEAGVRAMHVAVAIGGEIVAVNDVAQATAQAWLDEWRAPADMIALDRDDADPDFPLRIPLADARGAPIGWVLLGPRPDGSFYRREELEALAAIAVPLRRAVVTVRTRAAAAAEARRWQLRVAALDERVAKLERTSSPGRRRA